MVNNNDWNNGNGSKVPGIDDRPETAETNNKQVLPDVVLVKLNLTNEKRIPKGIPKKERTKATVKEAARGMEVSGSFEKVRKDRVDTGVHKEISNVIVKQFLHELREAGYKLSENTHYFKKNNGKRGFTVVTEWTKTTEIATIPEKTMEGIKILTEMFGYKNCHLWQNPAENGKTVWTVNLGGLIPPPLRTVKDLSFRKWVSPPVYTRQETVDPYENKKPRKLVRRKNQ